MEREVEETLLTMLMTRKIRGDQICIHNDSFKQLSSSWNAQRRLLFPDQWVMQSCKVAFYFLKHDIHA